MGTRRTHPIPLPHMGRLPLNRAQTSKDISNAKGVCLRRPVTDHHRQTPRNTTPACEDGRKRRENPPPGIQQTVATAKLTRYVHIRVSQATPRQSNTNALNKNGASVTLIPRSTLQGSANSKPSASSQILRIHQFAIVRFLTENPDPIEKGKTTNPGQSFKEGLLT